MLELAGMTSVQHETGYRSAVLFLIPGFALVTAALALAVGLAVARMLTDRTWGLEH